jgi:hypothetical protein
MKRIIFVVLFFIFCINVFASDEKKISQALYVSSYPHVFVSSSKLEFKTTVTLNIRNISKEKIIIDEIKYYSSDGELLQNYISKPFTIGAMGNRRYLGTGVKNNIKNSGPYFIVKWHSKIKVIPPIVETVVIGASGSLGISFVVPAKDISD